MINSIKFKEYLIVRDPELYQQLLDEGWRDLALGAMIPLAATGAYGLYQAKQQSATKPSFNNPESQYSKNEILVKKQVIPSNLIRSVQKNPEKWDRDIANLQQPGSQDIGFATHKDFMDKPITMYVVTDESLKRVYPDAGAYASFKDNYIVMPKSAFTELPTATSDGKLNKWGADTLAHELRHTTQKGDAPKERWQNQKGSIATPEGYHQYMHDPREMGVRLAAIKNLLDENLMKKTQEQLILNLDAQNILRSFKREPIDDYLDDGITNDDNIKLDAEKWVNSAYNEIKRKLNNGQYYTRRDVAFIKNNIIDPNPEIENSKKQNMITRAKQRKDQYLFKQEVNKLLNSYPKNEKDLLLFILDPDMYFANKIQNNFQLGDKTKIIQQEFVNTSNSIRNMVREMNHDAKNLINFYINLDSSQKQNYMKELLDNYDQVVKDQPFGSSSFAQIASKRVNTELNPQWRI